MSVRIGYGPAIGGRVADAARFRSLATSVERHGLDSLWLSERIGAEALDPVVGLTYAAALTNRIKLGFSVMVLPGRGPALVAKQLASLDRLAGGRLLPAFGLGTPDPREHDAFGVTASERAPWLEEALPLVRRFWSGEAVDHDSGRFHLHGVEVRPTPQRRMDVWLGGAGPSQLDRVGRLADGWLAGASTPQETGAGRRAIEAAAERHGRAMDPGHFGSIVSYARGDAGGEDLRAYVLRRRRGRPAAALDDLVARTPAAIVPLLERHVEQGVTKFVLVPVHEPDDWDAELAEVAAAIAPLQGMPVDGLPAAESRQPAAH